MSVHNRRLRLAAASAVAAVVARVVSVFAWPPDSDASHATMVATAGAHHAAWLLATYAEVACWLLAGFAVLTAIRLVPGRGFWCTQIGGWVYGASLVTLALVGGSQNGTTLVLAEQPGRSAMVKVVDALHSSPALAPFVTLVLLGELFLVVFAIGLARSRQVGWWFPVVSLISVVAYIATADSSSHLVVLAGFVPLGATWLALARMLDGNREAQAAAVDAVAVAA